MTASDQTSDNGRTDLLTHDDRVRSSDWDLGHRGPIARRGDWRRGEPIHLREVRTLRRLLGTLVVSASLALGVLTPVAVTAHNGTGGGRVIHACVSGRKIVMAPSSKTAKCPRGWRAVHWAKKGPKGSRGAVGAQGPQGEPGTGAGPQGDPGPKGEKGDTGATGADGQDGVSGYEIVTGTATASNTNAKTATASGPSGKSVVGGGWVVGGTADPAIRSSRPTSSTTWSVSGPATILSSYSLQAYAICMTAL